MTVTLTEPVKTLLEFAAAVSLFDKALDAPNVALGIVRFANALIDVSTDPALVDVLPPAFVAEVFSTILIVNESPTSLARLSSSIGLKVPGLYIPPLLNAVAVGIVGLAVFGLSMIEVGVISQALKRQNTPIASNFNARSFVHDC